MNTKYKNQGNSDAFANKWETLKTKSFDDFKKADSSVVLKDATNASHVPTPGFTYDTDISSVRLATEYGGLGLSLDESWKNANNVDASNDPQVSGLFHMVFDGSVYHPANYLRVYPDKYSNTSAIGVMSSVGELESALDRERSRRMLATGLNRFHQSIDARENSLDKKDKNVVELTTGSFIKLVASENDKGVQISRYFIPNSISTSSDMWTKLYLPFREDVVRGIITPVLKSTANKDTSVLKVAQYIITSIASHRKEVDAYNKSLKPEDQKKPRTYHSLFGVDEANKPGSYDDKLAQALKPIFKEFVAAKKAGNVDTTKYADAIINALQLIDPFKPKTKSITEYQFQDKRAELIYNTDRTFMKSLIKLQTLTDNNAFVSRVKADVQTYVSANPEIASDEIFSKFLAVVDSTVVGAPKSRNAIINAMADCKDALDKVNNANLQDESKAKRVEKEVVIESSRPSLYDTLLENYAANEFDQFLKNIELDYNKKATSTTPMDEKYTVFANFDELRSTLNKAGKPIDEMVLACVYRQFLQYINTNPLYKDVKHEILNITEDSKINIGVNGVIKEVPYQAWLDDKASQTLDAVLKRSKSIKLLSPIRRTYGVDYFPTKNGKHRYTIVPLFTFIKSVQGPQYVAFGNKDGTYREFNNDIAKRYNAGDGMNTIQSIQSMLNTYKEWADMNFKCYDASGLVADAVKENAPMEHVDITFANDEPEKTKKVAKDDVQTLMDGSEPAEDTVISEDDDSAFDTFSFDVK